MNTVIKPCGEGDTAYLAADIIKNGGLVAVPTETVYGLAADALNGEAVKKIFQAKGRPCDNPLIVHISDVNEAKRLGMDIPDSFFHLAERFWPGALTMIVKKSDIIPSETSGGLDTVAIRMPDSDITREIIRVSGCPLAAPSANISGSPSPTSAAHVANDMDGKIDMIVDGGDCKVGVESTVVTLVGEIPTILRPGGVTKEELESVVGRVEIHHAVTEELKSDEQAASPGMKYKHYAPKTQVIILDLKKKDYIKHLFLNKDDNIGALCFDEDLDCLNKLNIPAVSYGSEKSEPTQAAGLFSALRSCDKMKVDRIYARMPRVDGLGLAVYNRLIRAAAHKIEKPHMPLIIGLTGGSGAGKTTVADSFAQNGFSVINADRTAREVMTVGSRVLGELQKEFGEDILFSDGSLDRKLLASRAFADKASTARLNSITHPAIVLLILEKIKNSDSELILLDAPQLFESGLNMLCDLTVAVIADKQLRIKRIMERDGINYDAANRRIEASNSDEFFTRNCDKIIINNGQTAEVMNDAAKIALNLQRGR